MFRPSAHDSSNLDFTGKLLGIDGCRGGWICAVFEGGVLALEKYALIDAVFNKHPAFDACLVDMPIGLRNSAEQIRPDNESRRFISERGSTIFPAPCRQAVHATDLAAAYDENVRVLGCKFTPLTAGLMPKIREVDTFLTQHPPYKNRLTESHPEVCFASLAGRTLLTKKNSPEGQAESLSLLGQYVSIGQELVKEKAVQLKCAPDDIIDAVCLAVSAGFVSQGRYGTFPSQPETDDNGLLMRIIFPCP